MDTFIWWLFYEKESGRNKRLKPLTEDDWADMKHFVLLLLFIAVVVVLAIYAMGCASISVDLKQGTVKTVTLLKEIDVNNITFVSEPNGVLHCQVKGVSHVSSWTDSVVANIAAFFTGLFI